MAHTCLRDRVLLEGSDAGCEKDRCPSLGETQVEPEEVPPPSLCMQHVMERGRPRGLDKDTGIGLRKI